ncbi:MAG: hypothetical protein V8S12_03655 [Lachnospiraceae bacterium]
MILRTGSKGTSALELSKSVLNETAAPKGLLRSSSADSERSDEHSWNRKSESSTDPVCSGAVQTNCQGLLQVWALF